MTTPTLSMRIFGQMEREKGLKRVRSEAAKKARKTRRRLARPSPAMRKILAFLASRPDARLALHYNGSFVYYVSVCCINWDGSHTYCPYESPRRVTVATFRAIKKRGWLEYDRRRESGSLVTTREDGAREVVPIFDLDYRISDKGRKAVQKGD